SARPRSEGCRRPAREAPRSPGPDTGWLRAPCGRESSLGERLRDGLELAQVRQLGPAGREDGEIHVVALFSAGDLVEPEGTRGAHVRVLPAAVDLPARPLELPGGEDRVHLLERPLVRTEGARERGPHPREVLGAARIPIALRRDAKEASRRPRIEEERGVGPRVDLQIVPAWDAQSESERSPQTFLGARIARQREQAGSDRREGGAVG